MEEDLLLQPEGDAVELMLQGVDPNTGLPLELPDLDIGAFTPRTNISGVDHLGSYDEGFRTGMNQEYLRGFNQGAASKIMNGVLSRGTSILAKTGQSFAHLGGFLADVADETRDLITGENDPNDVGFLDNTFNNAVANAFSLMDENLREALPAHISREYGEGNILQKIGTAEFIANDVLDGLAFLASAYGTGGVGALAGKGAGIGLSKVAAKTGLSSAAAGTRFGKALSDAVAKTGLSSQLAGATLFNTVGEAGFEAKEIYETLKHELAERNPHMSEEEINQKAADSASSTFWLNAAGLLVPNAVQAMLFKFDKGNSLEAIRKSVRSGETTAEEVTKKAQNWTEFWKNMGTKSKNVTKKVATGKGIAGGAALSFISEGLWEENLQTAIQQYENRAALGDTDAGRVAGIGYNLINNAMGFGKAVAGAATFGLLSEGPQAGSDQDEGALAIALGGLIGGPFGAVSEMRRIKAEAQMRTDEESLWEGVKQVFAKAENILIDNIKSPYKQFGRDENGDPVILNEEGNVEVDPYKMYSIILNSLRNNQFVDEQFISSVKNDPVWSGYNTEMSLMSMVWNMKSSGLSDQDILDVINAQDEEHSNIFGEGNITKQSKSKIEKYLSLYKQALDEVANIDEFSGESQNNLFNNMMRKLNFYSLGKIEALNNLNDGTQEKLSEQILNLTEDIESTRSEILSNRETLKKQFLEELGEHQIIQQSLLNENIQEKDLLEYRLQELQDIEGTRIFSNPIPNLGKKGKLTESKVVEGRSASFPISDPHESVNRRNMGLRDQKVYQMGRATLAEQRLIEMESLGNSADSIIQEALLHISPSDKSKAFSTRKSKDVVNRVQARQSNIEQGIEDNLAGVEELLTDIITAKYMETPAKLKQYTKDVHNIEDIKQATPKEIRDIQEDLNNQKATLQAQLTESRKVSDRINKFNRISNESAESLDDFLNKNALDKEQDLKREAFDKQTQNIKDTIRLAKQPDYSNTGEIAEAFDKASKIKTAISEYPVGHYFMTTGLKNELLDKINKILDQLQKAEEEVTKREIAKVAVQAKTRDNFSTQIANALGSLPASTISIVKAKVPRVEEWLANPTPVNMEAACILCSSLLSNKEKSDILSIIQENLNDAGKSLEGLFSVEGSVMTSESWKSSPRGAVSTILAAVFGNIVTNNPDNKAIFPFIFHKNLEQLELDLQETNFDGLPQDKVDLFNSVMDLHKLALGLHDLKAYLTTRADMSKVHSSNIDRLNAEASKEVKNRIVPSAQQYSALVNIVNFLTSSTSTKGNGAFISYVEGIAGSGKTKEVAKRAVELYKATTNTKDNEIIATSYNDRATDLIQQSIFPGSTEATTSIDALLEKDLTGTKLIVLDEAPVLSNENTTNLINKVAKHNETAKNKVKILALGDPSQVAIERFPTITNSIIVKDSHRTTPLTGTFRTSIGSIVEFASNYRFNTEPVETTTARANKDIATAISSQENDHLGVHASDSLEDMVSMINKDSNRTKLVVVANSQRASQLRGRITQPNVDVLPYTSINGLEYNEVYIDLDQSELDDKGQPFPSSFDFNRAMFTGITRAKDYVFVRSSEISNAQPKEIADSIQTSAGIIKNNFDSFKAHVEQLDKLLKEEAGNVFKGSIEQTKVQDTASKKEQAIEEKGVQQLDQLEEQEADTATIGTPEVSDSETVTPSVRIELEGTEGNRHTIKLPNNFNLGSANDSTNLENIVEDEAHVVVAFNNATGRNDAVVIGRNGNNEWVEIGVLSNQDILSGAGKQMFGDIFDTIQDVETDINSIELKVPFQMQDLNPTILKTFKLVQAKPMEYSYEIGQEAVLNPDPLNYTLTLIKRAFSGSPNMNEITQAIETQDWNKISKLVTPRIFVDPESRDILGNSRFKPRLGIPTLVIDTGKTKQVVSLEFMPLNDNDSEYKTLKEFRSNVQQLSALSGLSYGTSRFNEMVDQVKSRFFIDQTKNNIVIEHNPHGPTPLQTANSIEVLAALPDDQKKAAIQILDKIFLSIYGPLYSRVVLEEKDALELIKKRPDLSIDQKFPSGRVNLVQTIDEGEPIPHKEFVMTKGYGTAQVAFNNIAKTNPVINGKSVIVRRDGKSYGKGLMAVDSKNDAWYKYIKDLYNTLSTSEVSQIVRELGLQIEIPIPGDLGYISNPESAKLIEDILRMSDNIDTDTLSKDKTKTFSQRVDLDTLDVITGFTGFSTAKNPNTNSYVRKPISLKQYNNIKLNTQQGRDLFNSLVQSNLSNIHPTSVILEDTSLPASTPTVEDTSILVPKQVDEEAAMIDKTKEAIEKDGSYIFAEIKDTDSDETAQIAWTEAEKFATRMNELNTDPNIQYSILDHNRSPYIYNYASDESIKKTLAFARPEFFKEDFDVQFDIESRLNSIITAGNNEDHKVIAEKLLERLDLLEGWTFHPATEPIGGSAVTINYNQFGEGRFNSRKTVTFDTQETFITDDTTVLHELMHIVGNEVLLADKNTLTEEQRQFRDSIEEIFNEYKAQGGSVALYDKQGGTSKINSIEEFFANLTNTTIIDKLKNSKFSKSNDSLLNRIIKALFTLFGLDTNLYEQAMFSFDSFISTGPKSVSNELSPNPVVTDPLEVKNLVERLKTLKKSKEYITWYVSTAMANGGVLPEELEAIGESVDSLVDNASGSIDSLVAQYKALEPNKKLAERILADILEDELLTDSDKAAELVLLIEEIKDSPDKKNFNRRSSGDPGTLISLTEAKRILEKLIPGITSNNNIDLIFTAQLIDQDPTLLGQVLPNILKLREFSVNGIPHVYDKVLRHEVLHFIYNHLVSEEDRKKIRRDLEKRDPAVIVMTDNQFEEHLAELFQEYEYVKPSIAARLKKFFRQLLSWFKFIEDNKDQLNEFFNDIYEGRYPVGNHKFEASFSAKNFTYITNNFGSTSSYRVAKQFVISELDKLMNKGKPYNNGYIRVSRLEAFDSLKQRVEDKIETTRQALEAQKSLRRSVTSDQRADISREIRSLTRDIITYETLLSKNTNSKKGEIVLVEMLSIIYPNWSIKDDVTSLSVEEQIILENELESNTDKLLYEHIRDNFTVNSELKLSDSVKDFLSFIQPRGQKDFLPSKLTYVKALILSQQLDWSSLDALKQAIADTSFSLNEQDNFTFAIITKLSKLIQDANRSIAPDMAIVPNDSGKVTFFYSPDGKAIEGSTLEELLKDSTLHKHELVTTSEDLLGRLQKLYPIDVARFNNLFKQGLAQNTLSELFSHFGSMQENNIYTANVSRSNSVRYDKGKGQNIETSYRETIEEKLIRLGGETPETLFTAEGSMAEAVVLLSKTDTEVKGVDSFFDSIGLKYMIKFVPKKPKQDLVEDLKNFINSWNNQVNKKVILGEQETDGVQLSDSNTTEELMGVSEFLEDQRTNLNAMATVLSLTSKDFTKTSVIDGENKKIYKYSNSSYFFNMLNTLLNSKEFKGSKGNRSWINIPEYLKTDFFKHNIFVQGLNRVLTAPITHDSITRGDFSTSFRRESNAQTHFREFVVGFLSNHINPNRFKGSYVQYIYPPADRPRIPGVFVDTLSQSDIREALGHIYEQIKSRKSINNIKNYDKNSTANAEIFNGLMNLSKEEAVQQAYDRMIQEAAKAYNTVESEQVNMPRNMRKAQLAINKFLDNPIEDKDLLNNKFRSKSSVGKEVKYLVPKFKSSILPMYELFFMNNYINSYFLNQIFVGDYSMFKPGTSGKDVVKRIAGPTATKQRLRVGGLGGAKPKFTVGVVKDEEIGADSVKSFLIRLMKDGDRVNKILPLFGKSFDSTDAQGFVLPSRWNDINKGVGRGYRLGNVMKPQHYEITTREGMPVPVFLKYSSVVLSDELLNSIDKLLPKGQPNLLRTIRQRMVDGQVDELVFSSGVKVGEPNSITIDTLLDTGFTTDSKVELSNSNFGLQLNPKSNVDSKVSLMTQLLYFLNILRTDKRKRWAKRVYGALSFLIEDGYKDLDDKIKTKRDVTSMIKKELEEPNSNNHALLELLNNDIGIDAPVLLKKSIISIISAVSKATIKPKFPGSKLVLQTSKGTEGVDLNYEIINGKLVAEVLVPRNSIPVEHQQAVLNGNTYFLTEADALAFRIPSTEIHSAVALKVKGFYDSKTNVIIAPKELVPIHGSDFDVDSLTMVTRARLNSDLSVINSFDLNLTDPEVTPVEFKIGSIGDPIGYERDSKDSPYKLSEDFEETIIDLINGHTQSIVDLGGSRPELKTRLKDEVKKLKDIRKKIALNIMTDFMLEAITHEDNLDRMLSPITLKNIEEVIGKDGLDLIDRSDWDLSNINDRMKAIRSTQDSGALVGVFANNMKSLAYMIGSGMSLDSMDNFNSLLRESKKLNEQGILEDSDLEDIQKRINTIIDTIKSKSGPEDVLIKEDLIFTIGGKTYTKVNDKVEAWQLQDSTVNAAIDNVKEQLLPAMNVNSNNGNAFSAMLGLGVPLEQIVSIYRQPTILHLNKSENSTKIGFRKAINDQLKTLVEIDSAIEEKLEENPVTGQELKDAIVRGQDSVDLPNFAEMNERERIVQYAALSIFNKSLKIGESLRVMSKFLEIVKNYPVFIEDFAKIESSLKDIGHIVDQSGSAFNPELDDTNKAIKDYTNSKSDVYLITHDSFAFHIPNFFNNNPHILSSYKVYRLLGDKIRSIFKIHSKEIDDLAREVVRKTGIQFKQGSEENRALVREQILKYLVSETLPQEVFSTGTREVSIGKKSITVDGAKAWTQNFIDRVQILLDQEASKIEVDDDYIPNSFLEGLTVVPDRRTGLKRLKFNAGSELDIDKVLDIRADFIKIKNDFVDTNNFSSVQTYKDFAIYAALEYGLSFGVSNYSMFIDPALYKELTDKLTSELNRLTSQGRRDSVSDYISAAIAFNNSTSLGRVRGMSNYIHSQNNKLSGSIEMLDDTLFFDLKYEMTPEQYAEVAEGTDPFKEFIVLGSGSKAETFVKAFDNRDRAEDTGSNIVVTYQRMGRIYNGIYEPAIEKYNISNAFEFDIPTIRVDNLSVDLVEGVTFKEEHLQGRKVRLVSTNDNFRRNPRWVTLEKVSDGTYKANNTTPPSDQLSGPEITPVVSGPPQSSFSETDQQTAKENVNNLLGKLIVDSQSIELKDKVDKYVKDGVSADRVSTFIRKFIRGEDPSSTPFEIATKVANKEWKVDSNQEIDKNTVRWTEAGGEFKSRTYDQFLQDVELNIIRTRNRGNIIHGMIQKFLAPEKAQELNASINKWLKESKLKKVFFNWLDNPQNIQTIFKKIGINTFDDIENKDKDVIKSELKIFSKVLRLAGTVDLLVRHSDGSFTLGDIKTSVTFDTPDSRTLRFGHNKHRSVTRSRLDMAKFQIAMYAFAIKVENPEARFRRLPIAWVPNSESLSTEESRVHEVDMVTYLDMIRKYLKNEMPEVWKEVQALDHFDSLFDPAQYSNNYSKRLEKDIAKEDSDQHVSVQLAKKIVQLKEAVQYQLNPHLLNSINSDDTFTAQQIERAKKLAADISELLNDSDVNLRNWNQDISVMSEWIASASSQNSPFIQIFEKFRNKRKQNFLKLWEKKRREFNVLFEPVYQQYLDREVPLEAALPKFLRDKAITDSVRNVLRLVGVKGAASDPNALWAFMYREVEVEGQKVLAYNYTDEHFDVRAKELRRPPITKEERALARYVQDEFEKFFNDNVTEDPSGTALANQIATVRSKTKRKGVIPSVPVSNLELFNGRFKNGKKFSTNAKAKPFQYEKGMFIPMTPKTLTEIALKDGITSSEFLKRGVQKWFTFYDEAEFDQWNNVEEGIPMKYLPNGTRERNQAAYSIDVEQQFHLFMRAYLYKQEMDDVFSFGRGVQYMLSSDDDDMPMLKRTSEFLKTHIEQVVLGRRQRDFEVFQRGNANYKVHKVNWVKVLRTFKQLTVMPIMWLKPITGTANGIFTAMFTLKEAIKGSIAKRSLLGTDDSVSDFTVSDLIWGFNEWRKMNVDWFLDREKGERNKTWMLVKELGYLPDNYDWATSSSEMVSTRNLVISQSSMLWFHSMPEEALATMIMLAQMRRIKVNATVNSDGTVSRGGSTSMFDMYDVIIDPNTGLQELKWKIDRETGKEFVRGVENIGTETRPELVEISSIDSREIQTMKRVYERLHGSYRAEERTKLEYYILGEMFLQYKKYLPNILKNALGSSRIEQQQGRFQYTDMPVNDRGDKQAVMNWIGRHVEGRWSVLTKTLTNYMGIRAKFDNPTNGRQRLINKFIPSRNEDYRLSELSAGQRSELVDALVTFGVFLTLSGGHLFMFSGTSDDDSFKKIMDRIINDFGQQYNIRELMKNISNLTPASLRKANKAIGSTIDLITAVTIDRAFGQDPFTQSGNLRGLAELKRSIPFISSWSDLVRFIENNETLEEYIFTKASL